MVYVDGTKGKSGYDWVHMIADTDEELFAMANKKSMSESWVKHGTYRRPHFELAQSKKKLAIKEGAIEVSVMELMALFPPPASIPDNELNLAELCMRYKGQPLEEKTDIDITAAVDGVYYRVPVYCLLDLMYNMPDTFFPCDKQKWVSFPAHHTTLEMVKAAIAADADKFKAFILYNQNNI